MFKCIALLKRKSGLSQEAFVHYYETRHAPLIRRLLPGIADYRRNYVDLEGAFASPDAAPLDFDVITEIRFADRTAYDRFVAKSAEPDIARQIAEDEENLFERQATRMFVVDEQGGALSPSPTPQALLDEREITRGLSRFARILDDKQWDRLGDVFAQDIRFDYGAGGEQQGMVALTVNMRRFLDGCGGTQHLIGSLLVDVEGDRATSRAYVQARHQRPSDPYGPVFDSNGEYVDQWERRPEGWRIVRRDALWAAQTGELAIIHGDG
ncbi:nuclear transport factor 2 family protein [Sphingobium sp. EM0848]|uniref:nuclear transport factor 2 family protein n=1 Tax=Sphingobium sp. EM0848 TaxID=2743473 RepID=UPI00159CBCED|nr:nuclear transport factor 2 family protein [Sphingobium sp. EM0848]